MEKQAVTVEVSIKTILTVVAVLVGIWLVYSLLSIVLLIFVAFIIASAIGPMLRNLQRYRIPQPLSIFLTIVLLLGLVSLIALAVIPTLVTQMQFFLQHLPDIMARVSSIFGGDDVDKSQWQNYSSQAVGALSGNASSLSSSAVQLGLGIFSGVISIITVVVMSVYMILEREQMYKAVALLMPHNDFVRVKKLSEEVELKLGAWVRGQLLLALIIGVASYIGLWALGLQQYALPLAIIAGLFELVPIIGPIIAAIPAALVALTVGDPTLALAVVILYVAIQQLEANLIVPKVMERAVGLNPLFVIVALLAGSALMGVMGALLSVPMAVVASIVLEDIRSHDRRASEG